MIGYILIPLLIYACFGALPAGWLASERGRSYVKWFLIGLVIGPFAIITVGLAPVSKWEPKPGPSWGTGELPKT